MAVLKLLIFFAWLFLKWLRKLSFYLNFTKTYKSYKSCEYRTTVLPMSWANLFSAITANQHMGSHIDDVSYIVLHV